MLDLCDGKDQSSITQVPFLKGKKMLTWNAAFIAGWDVTAQEYRAVGVDSNGSTFMFQGEIIGDQLIMNSIEKGPVRLRFTGDARVPGAMTWKNNVRRRRPLAHD